MSQVTAINAIPWLELTDAPNLQTATKGIADQIDGRLVPRFANSAARDAAITAPVQGMVCTLDTLPGAIQVRNASAWVTLSAPTDSNKTASVATAQTTTSTTYVDLGTVGPSVSIISAAQTAKVTLTATLSNTGGNHSFMGFAISGATTLAAADDRALFLPTGSGAPLRVSVSIAVTLSAGTNVVTAKYRAGANTAEFANRSIFVELM